MRKLKKRKANCLFIVSKVSSNNTAQWEFGWPQIDLPNIDDRSDVSV